MFLMLYKISDEGKVLQIFHTLLFERIKIIRLNY